MQATIYVSDDGYWMTEAEAVGLARGAVPSEIRVKRQLTATFVQEHKPVPGEDLAFRVFRPVVIEGTGGDLHDEIVSREMGKRMRHWEGREG